MNAPAFGDHGIFVHLAWRIPFDVLNDSGDIAGFCNAPVDEWEAYSEAINDVERQRRFPALDCALSEIMKKSASSFSGKQARKSYYDFLRSLIACPLTLRCGIVAVRVADVPVLPVVLVVHIVGDRPAGCVLYDADDAPVVVPEIFVILLGIPLERRPVTDLDSLAHHLPLTNIFALPDWPRGRPLLLYLCLSPHPKFATFGGPKYSRIGSIPEIGQWSQFGLSTAISALFSRIYGFGQQAI